MLSLSLVQRFSDVTQRVRLRNAETSDASFLSRRWLRAMYAVRAVAPRLPDPIAKNDGPIAVPHFETYRRNAETGIAKLRKQIVKL